MTIKGTAGMTFSTPDGKNMEQWFKRQMEIRLNLIERTIIRRLYYIGEECVNYARINGNYKDQTGNLRSSVGYVVFGRGKKYKSGGFDIVKKGKEGARESLMLAEKKAAELNSKGGFVLVVIAGMNYAHYVETKGYDVLTGAELLARRESESIGKDLIKKLIKNKKF